MPFVKEHFVAPEPISAFLFVMQTFNLSQREAQRLIGKGRLFVNDSQTFDSGQKISGDITVVHFRPKSRAHSPLFQTKDFMVFEKPSGTLVHPNTMATPYSILDEIRHHAGDYANAVHRIDMETSGLLLASKHKKAEQYLKGALERKRITKSYRAWADGEVKHSFRVDQPIARNTRQSNSTHKMRIDPEGKKAITDFVPLLYDRSLDATLLACYPLTGRTHQIRLHLFHVKHPILGDPVYGTEYDASDAYLDKKISADERLKATGASRLMLHAFSLTFKYKSQFYIASKTDFYQEKSLIADRGKRDFNR